MQMYDESEDVVGRAEKDLGGRGVLQRGCSLMSNRRMSNVFHFLILDIRFDG